MEAGSVDPGEQADPGELAGPAADADPGETQNVSEEHADRAARMSELLQSMASAGRESTIELDEASRLALESLGYVSGSEPAEQEGNKSDSHRASLRWPHVKPLARLIRLEMTCA